uniref:4-(cytidine 5'-diphospho)-2-C-methyl-D-erythritol kinase n=1 Tax=uncultured Draconibacterium sp. TaxID=1573823 RepID=UPI003216B805
MITFPNAKINIGLNVVSKRPDGYHNLETIFYPVKLADALEMVESDKTEFSSSGIEIDGKAENNLVFKAYQLLQKEYDLPPVKLHLHKVVPFGAGLGGGSADAAFTLKMLNSYFDLNISTEKLENYAAQIGADCPFFIQNKPTFASGIGDQFESVSLDLSAFEIVIVKPNVSVSTPEAYQNIIPASAGFNLKELKKLPVEDWKHVVKNDFEKSVFPNFPEIEKLKNKLYDLGAVYASMSGSGSAVFGIFRHLPTNFDKYLPKGIFIYR